MAIITLTAADGTEVQFYDELKASGGMKDVYFSLNRDYVVAFYRTPSVAAVEERLAVITVFIASVFLIKRVATTGKKYFAGRLPP